MNLDSAKALIGRQCLALGEVIGGAGDENLAENSPGPASRHQTDPGGTEGIRAENKVSHHGDLKELHVGDLVQARGGESPGLVGVDGIIE